jgi:enoyl-[acyl-carrier protein] reductase II
VAHAEALDDAGYGGAAHDGYVGGEFVEEWNRRQEEAKREAERLSEELLTAVRQGRGHELVPFTGQTAGMIREILPAGEIVRELVREAEETLKTAASLPR